MQLHVLHDAMHLRLRLHMQGEAPFLKDELPITTFRISFTIAPSRSHVSSSFNSLPQF